MNYYNEIKKELIDNEVYKRIKDYSKNKYELERYYNVGKLLVEAQGGEARARYGDELIKEYSRRLSKELGKGYSYRTLNYMRKFYLFQKVQPSVAQCVPCMVHNLRAKVPYMRIISEMLEKHRALTVMLGPKEVWNKIVGQRTET